MSTTPAELLSIAEEMARKGAEVWCRSASSRAYYSAYHLCLRLRPKIPHAAGERPGAHAAIIEDFAQFLGDPPEFQLKIRALGAMLNQCRIYRVKADYSLGEEFTQGDAEVTIEQVKRIEKRVMDLLR
jgi:uncharacterized protein (UPF0332 family)